MAAFIHRPDAWTAEMVTTTLVDLLAADESVLNAVALGYDEMGRTDAVQSSRIYAKDMAVAVRQLIIAKGRKP